jgi:hypothetical protein
MTDQHRKDLAPIVSSADLRSFLVAEWPYLAILVLALFGVAYTSVARQPILILHWAPLRPVST